MNQSSQAIRYNQRSQDCRSRARYTTTGVLEQMGDKKRKIEVIDLTEEDIGQHEKTQSYLEDPKANLMEEDTGQHEEKQGSLADPKANLTEEDTGQHFKKPKIAASNDMSIVYDQKMVHQRVASTNLPEPRSVISIYIVREEYRELVGLENKEGDLLTVEVLGAFKGLETANAYAKETADALAKEVKGSDSSREKWEKGGLIGFSIHDRVQGDHWRISVCLLGLCME